MAEITSIPVVILAGGKGFRVREDVEFHPKPMLEVGERPLISHLIDDLGEQGFSEFIICVGSKGNEIRDYFLNFHTRNVTVNLTVNENSVTHQVEGKARKKVNISIVETGSMSATGERLRLIQHITGERTFVCIYGDIFADVNLPNVIAFHRSHSGTATLTATHPRSRFNLVSFLTSGEVKDIKPRPIVDDWVNGGYYIFEPTIFNYLSEGCTLEDEPLSKLSLEGNLYAYPHNGFWQPVDTQRDVDELQVLWQKGQTPWKTESKDF